MTILESLTALIYALGAAQGVLFGLMLFNSREVNALANRLLALILLLWSYRLLVQTLRLYGLGYYDLWYYFMVDLSWVTGPLLYFYVRAQAEPGFRFVRRDGWHFVPVLLQLAMWCG